MDERKLQFSILLFPDLHSTEPIIHLNQMIRNETFTTGRASELKFYRTLKIKLQSSHEFNEICSLQFEFEGCKIDE
jgi:hypothetical protein